ncbi:MAG TPA: hypothetical protein VIP11_04830, partial [Gemmatimonadaceae bacterium]
MMRTRALVLIALLAPLASDLGAQLRIPRRGGQTPVDPAQPPAREVPEVSRALSLQRARWSASAYGMISAVQVPSVTGGATSYSAFGTGTHADYRVTNRFSATMDMSYSPLGSMVSTATAETGVRFKPMPFAEEIRPYFDLRAGYMYVSDYFNSTSTGIPGAQYQQGQRYSRGLGGIVGAGIEYTVFNSFSIAPGISAMRGRMNAYQLVNTASIPVKSAYSTTVYRFTVGLSYNPLRTTALKQN